MKFSKYAYYVIVAIIAFGVGFLFSARLSDRNRTTEGGSVSVPDAVTHATGSEYRQVERDLHSLNLVNALHLSGDQMRELLPLVREAKQDKMELKALLSGSYSPLMEVMRDMRSRLIEHNAITEQQQKTLDQYSIPIYRKTDRNRRHMEELVGRAREILTPNQLYIISVYEPCIVPDGRQVNPERIGSAVGGENFSKTLEEVRTMSGDRYESFKSNFLEEKRMMMNVYNTPEQIEKVLGEMESAMEKARSLSDVEFEIQKDELSDIAIPPRNPPDEDNINRGIAEFILNPFMEEYIGARLKNGEPVDYN